MLFVQFTVMTTGRAISSLEILNYRRLFWDSPTLRVERLVLRTWCPRRWRMNHYFSAYFLTRLSAVSSPRRLANPSSRHNRFDPARRCCPSQSSVTRGVSAWFRLWSSYVRRQKSPASISWSRAWRRLSETGSPVLIRPVVVGDLAHSAANYHGLLASRIKAVTMINQPINQFKCVIQKIITNSTMEKLFILFMFLPKFKVLFYYLRPISSFYILFYMFYCSALRVNINWW